MNDARFMFTQETNLFDNTVMIFNNVVIISRLICNNVSKVYKHFTYSIVVTYFLDFFLLLQ